MEHGHSHPLDTYGELVSRPIFEVDSVVIAHTKIVLNEFEIVMSAPEIALNAQAGQFVMLLFGEGYTSDARRPFSLFRVDSEAGTISILYLARGSFTSELSHKQVGDIVKLAGPLGTPFTWQSKEAARHILLAGGLGAPPIYFLAKTLAQHDAKAPNPESSVIVINGAKSADLLIGVSEFKALGIEVVVLTDDGSAGTQGLATDVLQKELAIAEQSPQSTRVYACGPMAMLHTVGVIGIEAGVSCQISIETAMPCGIGNCDGCAVRVIDVRSPTGERYVKACWDGPIFEASALAWKS